MVTQEHAYLKKRLPQITSLYNRKAPIQVECSYREGETVQKTLRCFLDEMG